MTGAGLALIAGGLATLISFRSMLFGGAERGERKRGRAGRRGRRRSVAAVPPEPSVSDEDDGGGLASIGLADEDDDEPFVQEAIFEDEIGEDRDEVEPDPVPARADRYGDRVEGWVRPEYQDPPDEPRPGEYWTPIPVDLAGDPEPSAKGYGWPRPVERLPAVPDYEPATGFDLIPISEPTEVVPTWAMNDDRPGRIRLPRSWNARNEKRPEKPEPRRPRPRPRPRPEQPIDPSTVYVSRHAADPPPRPE